MRTDTATRFIAASPEVLYRAFLDPEALAAWLPPAGMSGRILLFEPWEGGRYRIELTLEGEGHGVSGKTTDRPLRRMSVLANLLAHRRQGR